jgi:hypothetical protein
MKRNTAAFIRRARKGLFDQGKVSTNPSENQCEPPQTVHTAIYCRNEDVASLFQFSSVYSFMTLRAYTSIGRPLKVYHVDFAMENSAETRQLETI